MLFSTVAASTYIPCNGVPGFLFFPILDGGPGRAWLAWGSSRERKALWSGESRAASACGAFSPGLPTQPAALPNLAPGSWEAV